MDSNLDKIAKDLYGKIQVRFPDITFGDEEGNVLSKKTDIPNARFFEFEYVEDGEPLGTIAITLDEEDGLVMQVSGDLVDDDNDFRGGAYDFIKSFRKFAKTRLLNFDVQNIGKSELDKRDYQFQAKPKEDFIMENKMYGTNRMSYQDLGEARLIIKHSQPINLDLPAGRTMHIEGIYIENALGERFKYPSKHINGARALAEHIKHGGNPYDSLGKHICGLSEELAHLRKFKGYVSRQEQISEAMGVVTDKVLERIEQIKETIHKLQRPAFYEQYVESFQEQEEQEIPEAIVDHLIDRLTVRTFNEELKSVFPYIYKFIDESELPVKEITHEWFETDVDVSETAPKGWEGTVKAMKKHKEIDNPWALAHHMKNKGYKSHKKEDIEDTFENFMDSLVGEEMSNAQGQNLLFSKDEKIQQQAIQDFNDQVLSQELPAGTAVDTIRGFIDNPKFLEQLSDLDPDLDVRSMIQDFVQEEDPEVAAQLNFEGNATAEPAPAPAPAAPPTEPAAAAAPAQPTPPAAPAQPTPPAAPAAPVAENQNYTADEMVAILSGQKTQAQVDAERKSKPQPQPTNKPTTTTTPTKKESNDDIPFDGPYKKAGDVTDKSGATHSGHSRSRHLARQGLLKAIQKAKSAGAKLDTKLDFGHKEMTLHDAIRECGMTPMECGFEEQAEESGLPAMLRYVSGFYNRDEGNFPLGGMRVKIKVKKAFEDGEFGHSSPEDLMKVLKFIDMKDPSGDEQASVLKLAGVQKPEVAVGETGNMPDFDSMMQQVQGMMGNIQKDPAAKISQTSTSSGTINGQPANYDDAIAHANGMKFKLPKFGDDDTDDDVLDFGNPDQIQQVLQRKVGGALNKAQGQVPNQSIQFPGGQMNPADMMKAIMQKINFGK